MRAKTCHTLPWPGPSLGAGNRAFLPHAELCLSSGPKEVGEHIKQSSETPSYLGKVFIVS